MKVDPKKELDSYRVTRGAWRDLVVPPMRYLMVDGQGDPNTAAYAEALSVLYPVAYATKFASKQQLGRDYVVPDDVKRSVIPVLAHRIILKPEARIRGVKPEQVLAELLTTVDVPAVKVEDE